MKNFGRLDIYDLDCEHICVGSKDIKYIDESLVFKDVNGVYLNSSGNGCFLINSNFKNDGDKKSIAFNSLDSSGNGYTISMNSNNTNLNSNAFVINGDNNVISYTKFSIGSNNYSNTNYTFGFHNNHINLYDNNETYIFGNDLNFTRCIGQSNNYILGNSSNGEGHNLNGYTLHIRNKDSLIEMGNSHLLYTSTEAYNYDISGSYLSNNELLNDNIGENPTIYYNNHWNIISSNSNLQALIISSNIYNDTNIITKKSYIASNNNYNSNLSKIYNSVVIDKKNASIQKLDNTIFLNDSTINASPLSANFENSTFVGNDYSTPYSIVGKNALYINSSFKITTDGIGNGEDFISYEYLKIFSNVDGDFGEVINRVYTKASPFLTYSKDTIKNITKDSALKDCVKEVSINSDNETVLFNIEFEESYNTPIDFNLVEIYDLSDGTMSKIYYNRYGSLSPYCSNNVYYIPNDKIEKIMLDTLEANKYDFVYSTSTNVSTITFSVYAKKCKGKKFLIKFATYSLKTDISGKFTDTKSTGTKKKLCERPRSVYETKLQTTYPTNITFSTLNCTSYETNGYDMTIKKCYIHDLGDSTYKIPLDLFRFYDRGQHDVKSALKDKKVDEEYRGDIPYMFQSEGDYIAEIYGDAVTQTYLKSGQSEYKIDYLVKTDSFPDGYYWNEMNLDTLYGINNGTLDDDGKIIPGTRDVSNFTMFNDLKVKTYDKSSAKDKLVEGDFYKNGNCRFAKWGTMMQFYYRNDGCKGNFNDELDKIDNASYKQSFIPFVGLPFDQFNFFKPLGDFINLPIKIYYNNYMVQGVFCFGTTFKYGSIENLVPFISLPRDFYLNGAYGYTIHYNSIDSYFSTDKVRKIRTETIMYMCNSCMNKY